MVSLLLPVIYLAFISLGLPDSLLGSAWPVMYQELGTSVSSAGIISTPARRRSCARPGAAPG